MVHLVTLPETPEDIGKGNLFILRSGSVSNLFTIQLSRTHFDPYFRYFPRGPPSAHYAVAYRGVHSRYSRHTMYASPSNQMVKVGSLA